LLLLSCLRLVQLCCSSAFSDLFIVVIVRAQYVWIRLELSFVLVMLSFLPRAHLLVRLATPGFMVVL